jgi:vacuolar iron transporter family protein
LAAEFTCEPVFSRIKVRHPMMKKGAEIHRNHRVGWLRAAVLGANDGIVSTAALIVGVAAAEASRGNVLGAGLASLVAGALSMGAGTYVSVSSQSDTEKADLEREREELARDVQAEHRELAAIYVARGLETDLAQQVATQLMAKDALDAHARDELGICHSARPVQAAFASVCAFTAGAAFPLLLVFLVPVSRLVWVVSVSSLLVLALSGALAARAGGAPVWKSVARVTFWGTLATGLTAVIGALFGARL